MASFRVLNCSRGGSGLTLLERPGNSAGEEWLALQRLRLSNGFEISIPTLSKWARSLGTFRRPVSIKAAGSA